MTLKAQLNLLQVLVLLLSFPTAVSFGQQPETKTGNPIGTEVENAVRDFYKAINRGDNKTAETFIANESFFYDSSSKLTSGNDLKLALKHLADELTRTGAGYIYEVSELKIASSSSDVAAVNYHLQIKGIKNPNDTQLLDATDLLIRRAGTWQILAEHQSTIPKSLASIVSGLPTGWRRTPGATADRYQISIDKTVKHAGDASATIRFGCGDEQDAWASLGQPIAAEEYHGKRIRLTGWLRTVDVTGASLWMRIDGDRRELGFDNMRNRPVIGTSDWKNYSVVLDVPAEAKNIYIGFLLFGKGQAWADDLQLEIVDQSVPSTNIGPLSTDDNPSLMKAPRESNKRLVNLGFEDGAVH